MNRFRFETRWEGGSLRLKLRGILDGSSAWELRHALEACEERAIVLDMEGLVETRDFGAAVLAAGLRRLEVERLTILHAPPLVEEWMERYAVAAELVRS